MYNNIIFIAGIHGVGKTTFCKQLSEYYDIEHYSASTLIEKAKKQDFTSLFVDEIDKNQVSLINAIKYLLDQEKSYILDGHFCLLNKFKEIEKIPEDTFGLLGLKAIVLLVDNIHNIYIRLKNRDGVEYSLELLDRLQQNELEYSKFIASTLEVPYLVLDLSDTNYIDFIDKINLIPNI